jgi:hypothetical protein
MNLRRLFVYRKRKPRLPLGQDGDTGRHNEPSRNDSDIELAVPKREEAPRVLNKLIAAAEHSIEQSRILIAKVNEILAKHR